MPIDRHRKIPARALAILTLAATLGSGHAAHATTIASMGQPPEAGIRGHLFVPLASGMLPKGEFGLVLWQPDPSQANGIPVPTAWDAGAQTGFVPADPGTAQLGFRNIAGTTTAQMEGDTVGAYLNSADLPAAAAAAADQKLMITPEYQFPNGAQPMPFASSNGSVGFRMDLQVPVAVGNLAYVVLDFLFVDPNGVRISYGVKLFHNEEKQFAVETGYDTPSRSFMLNSPLGVDSRFVSAAAGSAAETGKPWLGWRHVAWTISDAQFVAALDYLAAQYPSVAISRDPAHYLLSQVHLNAEIHFTTAPAELGWSMRRASISLPH